MKFHSFRVCGTGHAGKLVIHTEVVLEGDGSESLVLGLNGDMLLGFQGLMQAIRIAPAGHETAGEFVHNDHLVVRHDVVHVALEDKMRLQGLHNVMLGHHVSGIKEIVQMGELLAVRDAFFRQHGRSGFFVHCVVIRLEVGDHIVHGLIQFGGFIARTGDDERCAGLVDENRVDFVDDGIIMSALHQLLGIKFHVVAQVVEAELIVRAIGDIAGVGSLALLIIHVMNDSACGQPEKGVNLPHPFGVAAREVIVDRDHMDTFARKGVQGNGKRGNESFAFAGLHLCDAAAVQDDTADELHIKMPHVHSPARSFAYQCKNIGQDIIQAHAVLLHFFTVLGHTDGEILIAEFLYLRFKGVYFTDNGPQFLEVPVIFAAKNQLEKGHEFSLRGGAIRDGMHLE